MKTFPLASVTFSILNIGPDLLVSACSLDASSIELLRTVSHAPRGGLLLPLGVGRRPEGTWRWSEPSAGDGRDLYGESIRRWTWHGRVRNCTARSPRDVVECHRCINGFTLR